MRKGGDSGGRLPTRAARATPASQPAGSSLGPDGGPAVQAGCSAHPAPTCLLFQNFHELATWNIKLATPLLPSGNVEAIKECTCL